MWYGISRTRSSTFSPDGMCVDDSAAQWLELFTTKMLKVDTIKLHRRKGVGCTGGGSLWQACDWRLSLTVHVMAAQVVFKQTSVVVGGL